MPLLFVLLDNRSCRKGHRPCYNRRCVANNRFCDGMDDCGDNSDEAFCNSGYLVCEYYYFASKFHLRRLFIFLLSIKENRQQNKYVVPLVGLFQTMVRPQKWLSIFKLWKHFTSYFLWSCLEDPVIISLLRCISYSTNNGTQYFVHLSIRPGALVSQLSV